MISLKNPNNRISYYLLYIVNIIKGSFFTLKGSNYENNNISLHYSKNMFGLANRALFFNKKYEFEEEYFVKKYISHNDTILELGGCFGYISCLSNKLIKDKSKHFVLEPNYKLLPYLEKNKNTNDCDFQIINKVISKKKKIKLFLNNSILGSSLVTKTKNSIEVNGITLDELQTQNAIIFNTLIIDIEGAELEFFKKNSLSNFKKVIVEFHEGPSHLNKNQVLECKQILINNNMSLVEKLNDVEVWVKDNNNFK